MNRLGSATSPYLRQHADNPVAWWPWGPDALATAAAADKPLLISIGYSACHWCHVMAHESFEDAATGEVMSDLFVNIKIDREEHPDVDAIYMAAVQAMTGHGGWPLTVWAFPDGRPFFGGTYFPKQGRGGAPGFVELCLAVEDAWRNRRQELDEQATKLTAAIARTSQLATTDAPQLPALATVLAHVATELGDRFDAEWGGFGRAPKFPQPDLVSAAVLAAEVAGATNCAQMANDTLLAMASGGIYDHLGGGFARYSTDAFWMVPHFEKMLYDQALITTAAAACLRQGGSPVLGQVIRETIAYVERDLAAKQGGFCAAEDADSEGEEGKFYVWPYRELAEVLDAAELDAATNWFGITKGGNFEGANILHRPVRGDLVRSAEVEQIRERLFAHRAERLRPGLDTKVLTEWNAYAATAWAAAAAALNEPALLARAEELCDLLSATTDDSGHFTRSIGPDGRANPGLPATAMDMAALLEALTLVAEASGRQRHLDAARRVADDLLDRFHDLENGGFFTRANDLDPLVVKAKDFLDNATPSANSTAAVGLARLGVLTGDQRYLESAEEILRLIAEPLANHPLAFAHALPALALVERRMVLDVGATLAPNEVPTRAGLVVRHGELAAVDTGAARLTGPKVEPTTATVADMASLLA